MTTLGVPSGLVVPAWVTAQGQRELVGVVVGRAAGRESTPWHRDRRRAVIQSGGGVEDPHDAAGLGRPRRESWGRCVRGQKPPPLMLRRSVSADRPSRGPGLWCVSWRSQFWPAYAPESGGGGGAP
jgi:hypothetical protein